MFTVKTKLEKSEIHGIGVFADEFILKGTVLWKYQENFDITLSDEQFELLPKLAKDFLSIMVIIVKAKEDMFFVVIMQGLQIIQNHQQCKC